MTRLLMLAACGDADVVVLSPDAQPLPGWLQQLAACLARDAAIATATPWCKPCTTARHPTSSNPSPENTFMKIEGQAALVTGCGSGLGLS